MRSNEGGKSGYDALMSAGQDYELEDILAEYGGGHGQRLLREVPELEEEPAAPAEEQEPEVILPKAPKPITLEDVVGSTVDAVMQEEEEVRLKKPKKGLFSRRKIEETEQLYDSPAPVVVEEE